MQSTTGGPITGPPDTLNVQFDDQGQLLATDTSGGQQVIGQVAVSHFANRAGLQATGQNIWTPTAASGAATPVAAGTPGAPIIVPGAVEGSNVDVSDEMTRMIQAQRGYQLNSKVVQAWDDIERMANELRA